MRMVSSLEAMVVGTMMCDAPAEAQRESSLMSTYWSESTTSPSGSVDRHAPWKF